MIALHPALFGLLIVLCLVACVLDLKVRRLPNLLSAITALAGLAQAIAFAPPETAWYWFAVHGLIALTVGIALYAFGWIGGGDAKFYAALACWLPLAKAPLLLTSVCLVGLLLLFVWFVVRRVQGKKVMGRSAEDAAKLPFGIAIALGGLLALAG